MHKEEREEQEVGDTDLAMDARLEGNCLRSLAWRLRDVSVEESATWGGRKRMLLFDKSRLRRRGSVHIGTGTCSRLLCEALNTCKRIRGPATKQKQRSTCNDLILFRNIGSTVNRFFLTLSS